MTAVTATGGFMGHEWARPSRYWRDYVEMFRYMLDDDVPLACFKYLRHHTYHLTGAMPAHYGSGWHSTLVNLADLVTTYRELAGKIPARYHLSEPATLGGFGVRVGESLVNADIIRFMMALVVFQQAGLLRDFETNQDLNVLEIGGGWGGFAHHFTRLVGRCRYFVIDLPEVLLFSATYLSLLNPDRKVYLYDHRTYEAEQSDGFARFDFVLLPNWAFKGLEGRIFDLVINQASFQEMTTEQVRVYLDGIAKICAGHLYSFNQNVQDRNRELSGLLDEISSRFVVTQYVPLASGASAQPQVLLWLVRAAVRELRRIGQSLALRAWRRNLIASNTALHLLCRPRAGAKSSYEVS
jgi:hypothetical protein